NKTRNDPHRRTPPAGLPKDPRPAPPARVAKLRENAPGSDSHCERKRTSPKSAPQFVARVTMMNANFIARLPGVMVTNRDHRRKEHIITGRYTWQSVAWFSIH